MLSPRLALLALLLLSCRAGSLAANPSQPAVPFGLSEGGCPPVSVELLNIFTVGSANGTTINRMQSAALACQLKAVLAKSSAGNKASTALLTTMYAAWREAYHPQVWTVPRTSQASWLTSLRTVVAINTNLSSKYWASLNAYSDLSPAEFATAILMTPAPVPQMASSNKATTAVPATTSTSSKKGTRRLLANCWNCQPAYPTAINWVTSGRVLPSIGFQAECASSWAFAAAAAVESSMMIATATATTSPLSPQHIMDCTSLLFNASAPACTRGSSTDALQLAATVGITAESAYRYRPATGSGGNLATAGQQAQCDRTFLTGQAAKVGLVRITSTPAYSQVAPTKLALIQSLAAKPVLSLLAVDPTFQHYAGGVWSSSSCAGMSANHALLVVGYSTETAGFEHFLAKNSMGANWGENGYVRIAMTDEGMCGMYQMLVQAGDAALVAPSKPGNSTTSSTKAAAATTTKKV